MGTYNVILFKNTGYNAVNVPDSPARLAYTNPDVHYIRVPDVQILQNKFLGSLTVKATWEEVRDCDYLKLIGSDGDWYYTIQGIEMLSLTTVRLSITPDFWTTAGGINSDKLQFLDGITIRSTVKDDTWGHYTDDDPLLAPQYPLKVRTYWMDFGGGEGGGDKSDVELGYPLDEDPIFIETTLDLPLMAISTAGTIYTDSGSSEDSGSKDSGSKDSESSKDSGSSKVHSSGSSVTLRNVPKVYTNRWETSIGVYGIGGSPGKANTNGNQIYVRNGWAYPSGATYNNEKSIKMGIARARALGVEGAISNQWTVPRGFVAMAAGETELVRVLTDDEIDEDAGGLNATETIYTLLLGINTSDKPSSSTSDMEADHGYDNVKNNRIKYGSYNKYGLMSCNGSTITANPEEIMSEPGYPEIACQADLHPGGKPYYRFKSINGNTEFWVNCIPGAVWANVSLVYNTASGGALAKLNYDTKTNAEDIQNNWNKINATQAYNQQVASTNYQRAQNQLASARNEMTTGFGKTASLGTGALGALASLAGGNIAGAISSAGMGLAGYFTADYTGQANQAQIELSNQYLSGQEARNRQGYYNTLGQIADTYTSTRQQEMAAYYTAQNVFVPTVACPYVADIMRDMHDNGVMLYKYYYDSRDLARIDKLLTMYGYAESEPLDIKNLHRRKYFDYIQTQGISVIGYPKWFCDGLAAQFTSGFRIWHVKPDPSHYTDNPINS